MPRPKLNVKPSATRAALLQVVERHPGLTTRAAAAAVGVDDSTAAYHLGKLRMEQQIVTRRFGRGTLHASVKLPPRERLLAAASPEGRAALAVLEEDGGTLRAVDIARRADLPLRATRWAVGRLCRLGLVRKLPGGKYEANPLGPSVGAS